MVKNDKIRANHAQKETEGIIQTQSLLPQHAEHQEIKQDLLAPVTSMPTDHLYAYILLLSSSYLISNSLSTKSSLAWEQLQEREAEGHNFQGHKSQAQAEALLSYSWGTLLLLVPA